MSGASACLPFRRTSVGTLLDLKRAFGVGLIKLMYNSEKLETLEISLEEQGSQTYLCMCGKSDILVFCQALSSFYSDFKEA